MKKPKSSHFLIHKDSQAYSSFPWAVIESDGSIRIVFRQAGQRSVAAAAANVVTHHDPDSWIAELQGRFDGEKFVVSSAAKKVFQSEFGVNDPALTRLKNGDLVLRVSEIQVVPSQDRAKLKGPILSHRVEHGLVSTLTGLAFLRAPGGDWSRASLTRVGAGEIPALCTREPVLELADGSLGISAYYGAPAIPDRAVFIRSFDGGKTWGDLSVISQDDANARSDLMGLNFNETAVADLGQGRMIAMIRCDESFTTSDGVFMPVGGVGNFHTAFSFNSGLSWSRPRPTEIFGQPAHLLPLGEGRVLCTYGYRKKPFGVRAVISHDHGMTWDMKNEIILRDDGLSWDLGYPMTVRLADGAFLTVYYMSDANSVRYIEGTRWELP